MTEPMRILVTAASKHGSTAEIGYAIAQTLTRKQLQAVWARIEDVQSVDPYQAFVIGSAVYYGQWLQEAKRLVDDNAAALARRPVWLFSSGPLGDVGHQLPEGHAADVTAMRNITRCVEHRTFAGKLDKAKLSFNERAVATALHAPEGDFRDWTAVETFATDIAEELSTNR